MTDFERTCRAWKRCCWTSRLRFHASRLSSSTSTTLKHSSVPVSQPHLNAEIRSDLGIGAHVRLVEPKTIERSMGKAQRVVDKRQL